MVQRPSPLAVFLYTPDSKPLPAATFLQDGQGLEVVVGAAVVVVGSAVVVAGGAGHRDIWLKDPVSEFFGGLTIDENSSSFKPGKSSGQEAATGSAVLYTRTPWSYISQYPDCVRIFIPFIFI